MINSKFIPCSPYYHHLRMPLLELAKGSPARVLEIGCGGGQSLAYLKERGAAFVVGIELVPEVAELARSNRMIDQVIIGDIERCDLPFKQDFFDLVIASHVLEHVVDPWTVLRRLRPFMTSAGQLIGSLPNVRNYSVVFPLVFSGRWNYSADGIQDWTHAKYFTKSTVRDLLESTGFRVERVQGEIKWRKKFRLVDLLSFGLLRDFLAYTNNFSARKL